MIYCVVRVTNFIRYLKANISNVNNLCVLEVDGCRSRCLESKRCWKLLKNLTEISQQEKLLDGEIMCHFSCHLGFNFKNHIHVSDFKVQFYGTKKAQSKVLQNKSTHSSCFVSIKCEVSKYEYIMAVTSHFKSLRPISLMPRDTAKSAFKKVLSFTRNLLRLILIPFLGEDTLSLHFKAKPSEDTKKEINYHFYLILFFR